MYQLSGMILRATVYFPLKQIIISELFEVTEIINCRYETDSKVPASLADSTQLMARQPRMRPSLPRDSK